MIMNKQTAEAYALKSAVTGAIAVAVIVLLAAIFKQPVVEAARFNDTYVVLHPSVFKSAFLALGFWGVIGSAVGGLLLGAAVWNDKYGVAPRIFGDNTDATVGIIGSLAGALIIIFSFLVPAYRVQTGTTKTVTKTELESIKHIDREFKSAFQLDSNLVKTIKTDAELK